MLVKKISSISGRRPFLADRLPINECYKLDIQLTIYIVIKCKPVRINILKDKDFVALITSAID
jgi:hypothetical protein